MKGYIKLQSHSLIAWEQLKFRWVSFSNWKNTHKTLKFIIVDSEKLNSEPLFFENWFMLYPWAFPDYSPVTVEKHHHFPKLWLFISAVIITHFGKQECKWKEPLGFYSVRDSIENLASGRWKIRIVGVCFLNIAF